MNPTTIAILFADLAGYTALSEAHGDLDAAEVAVSFYEMARSSLRGDARIVKPIGDAVMIVASGAVPLLETALCLRDQTEQTAHFPHLRVGLHTGPAVEREGDFFGNTVNLASRVAGLAQGGEILCTRPFADAVRDALPDLVWIERGPTSLKNIAQPVELLALGGATPPASLHPFTDPVCRMRVGASSAFQREVNGVRYYFCSKGCADAFAAPVQ
jgi:class 3 adenylate cyclase